MTDRYKELRERNEKQWGTDRFRIADHLGREAHVEVSDLLAELVQNAEDAKARQLVFQVLDDGLLVWNDGRPFDDRDVQAITGLLVSEKSASAIGYFGIGFKAVLLVTKTPCVLSGDYRFWLKGGLDPYPLGVPSDDGEASPTLPPFLTTVDRDTTFFWLPWRDTGSRERVVQELEGIRDHLEAFLLFLNNLQTLELNGNRYEAVREEWTPHAWRVRLRAPDGSEARYLRLCWTVRPSREVVEGVLATLERDDARRRRWEENPGEDLFGVAFQLDSDGRPKETEGKIFVYLPTSEISGLRFHLQGRMALTGDRKRVKPEDPMTCWALEELREKIRRLPEWLRAAEMFPAIWRVLPKKGEVKEPWESVAEALWEVLQNGNFFNGDDGQLYPREQVRLAHREELYDLLAGEDLAEIVEARDVRWVHKELRSDRAAREVIRSLDVKEVGREEVLDWLEKKTDPRWWKERDTRWLQMLYRYLKDESSRPKSQDRLKGLPLVRLRDGTHVRPGEAILPPEDPNGLPEPLRPELNRIPMVDDELAQEFRDLLYKWGVRDFQVELAVEYMLKRFYGEPTNPPSAEENRQHIRLIFELRNKFSPDRLKAWGQKWPLLRDENGRYVEPCKAYLPPGLGGLKEMRTYLRMAGGRPIVTADYRQELDAEDEWRHFLEALGCARLPRVKSTRKRLGQDSVWPWCHEREIQRSEEYPTDPVWDGFDWEVDGLEEILNYMAQRKLTVEEARALWTVGKELANCRGLVSDACGGSYTLRYSQSALIWSYRRKRIKKEGVAYWVQRLRKTAWLPDEQESPHRPDELWDPGLKPLLSLEGFDYLHPQIPVEDHREWAKLLNLNMETDVDSVCRALDHRLQRGAGLEEIRRVYEWLERRCEKEEIRDAIRRSFEDKALILVPGMGRYRRTEVCWEDPRGLLPEIRPYWEEFRRLFVEFLGVCDRPGTDSIARYLLESLRNRKEPDEWKRAAQEVQRQWNEVSDELRRSLRETRWPGKRGSTREWRLPRELYIADNLEKARLFEGKVTWWEWEDLEGLAEKLGVKRVSDAEPYLRPGPDQGEAGGFVEELKRLWEAVRWFASTKGATRDHGLREDPPKIRKTGHLRVTYHWDGLESEPVEKTACLNVKEWVLWIATGADVWDIGDALEEGLGIERLREFLKNIWDIKNKEEWERMLERWRVKLGAGDAPPGFPGIPSERLDVDRPIGPGGPVGSPEDMDGDTLSDSKRAGLTLEAMERAKQWLKKEGFSNIKEHRQGYDLEAFRGDEVRYVEVKGLRQMGSFVMTKNEWEAAQREGTKYWLFVYVKDEGKEWAIPDPTSKLKGQEYKREMILYRIEEDWSQKVSPLSEPSTGP